MKNLKNSILNGKVSTIEVSEKTGKNFIKISFFDKFIKNPLTGKLLSAGKKKTVKIYEGARGYADAFEVLETGELFSCFGCLMSFDIQGDNDVIKYNRLILEEDESDLEEIYNDEKAYWLEQGLLVEDKHSESKEEDMTISKSTEKAEAEAAAKLLAETAGQE
jgi:hypothetical protein